jgi:hypothetical protein
VSVASIFSHINEYILLEITSIILLQKGIQTREIMTLEKKVGCNPFVVFTL